MPEQNLLVHEIFKSIQGESTWSGLPCIFVRLRGCPLRCNYCDTSYAFHEGTKISIEDILKQIQSMKTPLIEVTGGEPLLQQNVHLLIDTLLDSGHQVLLETSGERDISVCDPRVYRIIDIKTPCSGAAGSFLESNYDVLSSIDEVKFVICTREDFDWAIGIVQEHALIERVNAVHFSPVMEQPSDDFIQGCASLDPAELSDWILKSGLAIRMHLQVHKYIWPPQTRGV
jgi:7-carboxy-7-deazaguanine synthase